MAGTQFGLPPKQINSLVYTGPELAIVPVVEAQRDPTVNDKQQPIDCFWRNNVTRKLWWLSGFDSTGALWVLLTAGSTGPVLTLSDNAGTLVAPTVAGNIQLAAGPGITTVSMPASNLITIGLTGGGTAIDQIAVDAFTAPGTNPVVPTALGQITVTGAQVAAGTVGANVIRTDSLAANTYTIEIQRSTAVSASNSVNNGVAHFNNAFGQFTVDANGFVSTNGSGVIKWNTIAAPLTLAVNNGYICTAGGTLSLALPATSVLGDMIEIALNGATGFIITQTAGQQIRWSGSTTTLGVTGTLATTGTGDSIRLVCETANTIWVGLSGNGNLTVT